ncbi:sialin [Chrysoperla carnea]|uniref:sialin n=1 Tax=Chrysoperla carnea TaxID=189513 RepID=UPI001D0766F6|nr:sialin [Chrysoperla carnea]
MGFTEKITCLQVLNGMVIVGFMFNYMLRVNLTIAIVAMVRHDTAISNATELNSTTAPLIPNDELELSERRYDWDERQQNLILGSFYWGYILTELPGGRLAEIIGARRVFGYSMLISSALTLITPFLTSVHYIAIVILRAVIGFMLGATWPAIPPMAAAWIPPLERSKFIANMMASSLGAAITLPICGVLIASFGWPSVFYATGVVGIVWSILWFVLIFDSPEQHPRISAEEKQYITNAISVHGGQNNKPDHVPWGKIFTSTPVWAIIITHGCSVFGYFSITNQLPTYMKYILNYNIKANGLLTSLPYLGKYFFAVLTSYIADYLRRSGRLTTTQTRKSFTTFAVMTPGFLMILQVFFGYDRVWSIIIFTVALTCNGAVTAGYLSNGLDIAPNFSGTIFGLANTLSSGGGFLSALIVGTLTYHNQTYGQWQYVFAILAVTYIFGALVYLIFGSGELQPWNSGPVKAQPTQNGVDAEVVPLKETPPPSEKA